MHSNTSRFSRLVPLTGILSATLLLSGCGILQQLAAPGDATRNDDGSVVEGNNNTDVFLLRVGDCLNDAEVSGEVDSVPTVPCDEPHDSEVYAETHLTLTSYDDFTVEDAANEFCMDAFEGFTGISIDETSLGFNYYMPTAESWADGDRVVSCLVFALERTTGTLRGAAI